jgi:ubiquinone biosynthesis protein
MSQVHRAVLKNGREIIVKVRRPGIKKVIKSDIDILYYLAGQFERHFPEFGLAQPRDVIREFEKSIQQELDFTFERNHVNRFHKGFEGNPHIHIPEVYWNLSTKRVLTEEYLEGTKVTDLDNMAALLKGDRLFLAEKGCEAILYQILKLGLFHGDPHPGNVLILGHDQIGFLDFGIVGHLDDHTREAMILVLSAIFKRDLDRFIRYLLVIGTATRPIDRRAFRADALLFMDTCVGIEKQNLEVGRMLIRFLELLRQYGLRIPANLVLLIKSIITIEGVGIMLSPEFNITNVLAPYVSDLVAQQLQPAQVMTRLTRYAEETLFFAKRVPEDFGETLRRIRENKLEIGFQHKGLDRLTATVERAINRLALAIFAGALILGSSLIIKYRIGPAFRGASLLGLAGYLLAFVIGMWVVAGIVRSRRI